MKIYSWNMLYRNHELDRAFAFISQSDFDIFCLQEVPDAFLKRLQALSFHVVSRIDVERLFGADTVRNHVVIVSKHPIVTSGEIPFPEYWHLLPARTRVFVHAMPSKFFTKIRNRGGLFADITMPDMTVRIFNLHLVLAQPAWRLKEFELAMAERDLAKPTVVCGDFNTLERSHITPLNWLLGGTVGDALFHARERLRLEKHFVEHDLLNPLSGNATHTTSRSQLDHILVSRTLTVKDASVVPDRFGSDHHPIRVEIA
jgi:endonuclease/exonuclease/phosphatase family metal-dependent hydrolase